MHEFFRRKKRRAKSSRLNSEHTHTHTHTNRNQTFFFEIRTNEGNYYMLFIVFTDIKYLYK